MSDRPVFIGLVQDGVLRLDFKRQYDAYIKRFEGDEVEVTIAKRRSRRSDRQNRAFHAALVPWAEFLGDDVESLKDELLALEFGFDEVKSPLTGAIKRVLHEPHTSILDTLKFSRLFERAAVEAAGTGYVMQMPDEYLKAKEQLRKRAAKKDEAA